MLNSYTVGDSGKVSVRRSAFSQTCALLGQFVKEKKAFGDLSFRMTGGANSAFRRTTMNLFPVNDKAEEANFTSLKPDSSEIKSAPMTIFYAGQVIVFNDFPVDKAKEIMELARVEIPQNPNVTTPVVVFNDNNNDSNNDHPTTKSVLDLTTLSPPRLNVHPTSLCNTHQMQKRAQKFIPPTFDGGLPMVRKASLQRFLGKRKERIAAKAPYNTSKPGNDPLKSKSNESNSWLGLAAVASGAELP